MIFRDSASVAGIMRRNSFFTVRHQLLRFMRHPQQRPYLHHVATIGDMSSSNNTSMITALSSPSAAPALNH
jgi:hypothetical protein